MRWRAWRLSSWLRRTTLERFSIELDVRSLCGYQDNRRLWNGPRHNIACAADTSNLRVKGVEIRLYEPESRKIIDALACLPVELREQVEVVDVGQLAGRLKAWQHGVFQTPAAAMDGVIFSRPLQVIQVVEALARSQTQRPVSLVQPDIKASRTGCLPQDLPLEQ